MATIKIKPVQVMFALAVVCLAAFAFTGTARAVEFIDGDTIPAGVVINDDVFIAGDTVVIDGTVNGDLFAGGATVLVNGVVNGSLFIGAQSATINGSVTGSVYFGGSSLEMGSEAQVGRNLYFGGFALESLPGSTIGRDMLVGGYQAVLAGEVNRDVLAGAAALELNGRVGGDVNVEIGEAGNLTMMPFYSPPGAPAMINPGLRIGEGAEIDGTLTYTSRQEQSNAIRSAPEGGIVYQTPVLVETGVGGAPLQEGLELRIGRWILARVREFITLLVLGGLAIWLAPVILQRWSDKLYREPLPAAAWGLVSMLIGYAGAVLLAFAILAIGLLLGVITLGGLARTVFGVGFSGLGLAFTAFTFFVAYGSKLIVAYLGGTLVLKQLAPQEQVKPIWPMLVGILLYVFLRSIPFIGWLFGLVATLLGLGAIYLVFRDSRQPAALPAATV